MFENLTSMEARQDRCSITDPLLLWFSVVFFVACLVVLAACLADWGLNTMHSEIFVAELRYIRAGLKPRWHDIFRFLDCMPSSDECGRARYLSFLFFYLNTPFRLWLARFAPPHPSVSLNWAFAFGSIYFMYATVRELTKDRAAAFLTTGLYVVSAGFLSLVLFLFNPAKPLAAFFVNFCLYLATKTWNSPEKSPYSASALLLYASLILAYCSDETTWVLPSAILILFPGLLHRKHWRLSSSILGTFVLFLFFATFIAPLATRLVWHYQNVQFWDYVFNIGARRNPADALHPFSINAIWNVVYNMALSQYAWWWSGSTAVKLSLVFALACVAAAAALANSEKRALVLRTGILLGWFCVFQGLVMLRHYSADGSYYYSALFSNFSLPLVGAAIACINGRRLASLACMVLCLYFGYAAFTWAYKVNGSMANDQLFTIVMQTNELGDLAESLTPGASLTYRKVRDYWCERREGDDEATNLAFAPRDAYVVLETDYVRNKDRTFGSCAH